MAREKHNKMVCNRCGLRFDISDAAITYRDFAGIKMREKKCPECGGSFRAIELPEELDIYLFSDRDKRYYSYSDKGKN